MKKALVLMRRLSLLHADGMTYPTVAVVYDTNDFNATSFDPEANARAELEVFKNDFMSKFPEFKHATWSIHEHADIIEVKPS